MKNHFPASVLQKKLRPVAFSPMFESPMQRLLILAFLLCLGTLLPAQDSTHLAFFQPSPTFHKGRFWTTAGAGTAIYSGFSIALWEAWYKDFELGPFRLFNDWGEWEAMDKIGHTFTAYNEANWSFQGALWTGMDRRKAMWTGVGIGMGLQTTVEVMDGFSEKWGFSIPDMAFNTLGVGMFATQEMLWQEQRITFKMSSSPPEYPDFMVMSNDGSPPTSLKTRADDLYGTSFSEIFLKDYNGQSYWLSFNIHSFLPDRETSRFPKWLNIAVGYGAENMFGGFENAWPAEAPIYFLDEEAYPRYRQFYLSFDVDLRRIESRNYFLKMLLSVVNFIKIPSPTLEFNTLGEVKFRPIYW